MADEDKIPLNEDQEEYHFTDEDIDKELSQLDEAEDVQHDQQEEMVEAVEPEMGESDVSSEPPMGTSPKERLLALIAKLKAIDYKNLTRKQMMIAVGGGVVVLFVLASMLGGGSTKQSTAEGSGALSQPRGNSANTPSLNQQASFSGQNQQASFNGQNQQAGINQNVAPYQNVQRSYPDQNQNYTPKTTATMFGNASQSPTNQESSAGSNATSDKVNEDIKVLKQNDQKIATQINIMSSKISSLESDMGSINHQLLMISDKLQTMQSGTNNSSNSNHPMAASSSSQQKEYKPKTESETRQSYTPPKGVTSDTTYTVQAVVPGRAWLQASDGKTVSVSVGEDVPGLGRVVSINSYSGDVTTSTGVVVKYGTGI